MPLRSNGFFNLPVARLSRRVVLWVFISVVVIEAIILIPSYHNRQVELLRQLKEISAARIALIQKIDPHPMAPEKLLGQMETLLAQSVILGGSLYSSSGSPLGTFGEPPRLTFADVRSHGTLARLSPDGTRYDAACPTLQPSDQYLLVLRQDATSVQQELKRFVMRIAGLVLIISLFVTAGAWIALGPIVITPILKLRNDLFQAGEAVLNDHLAPDFTANRVERHDELGDVISAFTRMFAKITDAINQRKRAETALQESYRKIEEYSQVLKAELEKGRQMQMNFLPSTLLQKRDWEIAAFFKPAHQVAGDFYDVFELSEQRIGIVVADVCDKGVGAALFMALFRSLIRVFSGQTALEGLVCPLPHLPPKPPAAQDGGQPEDTNHHNPLRAIQLTNNYIAQNHDELAMFATLFFGVLDTRTAKLTYINAGHDPAYVLSAEGGIRTTLAPTGPAVGLTADAEFAIAETQLRPGETWLGYTDGVIEAIGRDNEFFSAKRLIGVLEKAAPSADGLIERVKTSILDFAGQGEQFDDITLLALRRKP
jgi:sigma-B regulation protein RsbU (phosphoserine phosphatase)